MLTYANTTQINPNHHTYGHWQMQFGKQNAAIPNNIHVSAMGFDSGHLSTEEDTCRHQNAALSIQTTTFTGAALKQALSRHLFHLTSQYVDILKYQSTSKNLQDNTAQTGQVRALLQYIDTKNTYSGMHIQYCSGYSEYFIQLTPNKALYLFTNQDNERYVLFSKK
ncbi:hypothetical protein [Vitreoscilla sp. C1]|uniref:hypothetical protein n=1 Tax=Vitreoscilla sp. (strain C1) TaxID=96942 RepID=UPI0012DE8D3C|nr:hypothetical protein [Vitreoscilla sp. C1]